MGNTCASVHILWRRKVDDVVKAVSRSYSKLGYERVKKAPLEGGKHVILRAGAGQSYVSVYDSDNAALDNGELKELALAASKALKTTAVFTSLYDSDRYEFVVFASGRQVDLLMTDVTSYTGPLKQLSDKARATKWSALFGRMLTADQITQAAGRETVFADGSVADLSKLIGLSGSQAQTNYQDFLDGGEEITAQLYFRRKQMTVSEIPAGEIRLANTFDPDDTRMLLVYPASWPVAAGKPTNVKWLILSEGAGFKGGSASIRVSGPEGPVLAPVLTRGAMRGFKFHHGQIVGDLETRPTDKDHVKDYYAFPITAIASTTPGSQSYTAEFPNLDIPAMTPERTTQILIILMFYDLESQTAGEWEINVSLQPGAQSEYRYDLPPMRIAAVEPRWLPVVSGLNPKTTYAQSGFSSDPRLEENFVRELKDKQARIPDERLLSHPAITSSVAILRDEGQVTLDACKNWLEEWLRQISESDLGVACGRGRPPHKGEIRTYTEKKLPAGVFKPSKSKKNLPADAFLQDKAWGNLFGYANNYQSVLVAFFPEGGERAVAGVGLQYSHERHYFPGSFNTEMAKTLSLIRGRPFPEEDYGSTLHAFKWVTNHADCYGYLNTSASEMGLQLDRFAADNRPLQAWNSQATWVPLFDQAAHIKLTVYENASVLNWFRGGTSGGLYRKMMCAQWCSNVLRMVSPHLWLCRNLMDQVNRTALEQVAQVTEINGAFKIELRSGCALDELELALLPILPIESVRISVMSQEV